MRLRVVTGCNAEVRFRSAVTLGYMSQSLLVRVGTASNALFEAVSNFRRVLLLSAFCNRCTPSIHLRSRVAALRKFVLSLMQVGLACRVCAGVRTHRNRHLSVEENPRVAGRRRKKFEFAMLTPARFRNVGIHVTSDSTRRGSSESLFLARTLASFATRSGRWTKLL